MDLCILRNLETCRALCDLLEYKEESSFIFLSLIVCAFVQPLTTYYSHSIWEPTLPQLTVQPCTTHDPCIAHVLVCIAVSAIQRHTQHTAEDLLTIKIIPCSWGWTLPSPLLPPLPLLLLFHLLLLLHLPSLLLLLLLPAHPCLSCPCVIVSGLMVRSRSWLSGPGPAGLFFFASQAAAAVQDKWSANEIAQHYKRQDVWKIPSSTASSRSEIYQKCQYIIFKYWIYGHSICELRRTHSALYIFHEFIGVKFSAII